MLNFIAAKCKNARDTAIDFTNENPDTMIRIWKGIVLSMLERHYISAEDMNEKRFHKIFRIIHESQPKTFKDLISIQGIGLRIVATLTLVAEFVYQAPPSFRDPTRLSFTHAGKDDHVSC